MATFHAALLEGLRQDGSEVTLVGVISPTPLRAGAPVPVFERPAELPLARFYADLLERLAPDVVLMNHVAHTIGVTHARLDSPPPAVGIAHSWHNITFADPGEVARRREVTQEALDGLAALVVGSRHCLEEGQRLGMRYPAVAEAIHYPLQPLYLDPEIDVGAGDRDGVLFLGSLTARKGPESLVEAANRHLDADVVLAGEGELEAPLRESIARAGSGDRVRLQRHFPPDEHLGRIRDLLLGTEVMCLPSRSESFGLAFIEALACGTPVVGFGPTVREIGEEMGTEIGVPLEQGTPEEIAAAIADVRAAEWDREGLRRATLDAFGLERATRRYVELLSS